MLRRKMYSTKNAYKEKKAQINDLNSHPKNLERKEEQSKSNVYKTDEIIKSRNQWN